MAIEAIKTVVGNGRALVNITGLAAVGTSTKGGEQEIPLDDIGITGGEVFGFEVSCSSVDFDIIIGRKGLDFTASAGLALALLIKTGINIGNSHHQTPRALYFDGNLYFRLNNDDGANTTGTITIMLTLDY